MAVKRAYPRSTIRKMVKAHSNRSVSKNTDMLVFLDYTLFIQDLMNEASKHGVKGKKGNINADSVKKATEMSLMRFKF